MTCLAIRMPSRGQRLGQRSSPSKEVVMGRATLAFLLLLLIPAFALAQSARESWDNLKQLHTGQKIEVIDTSMKSHHGRFVSVSDDTLSLQEGKSEHAI